MNAQVMTGSQLLVWGTRKLRDAGGQQASNDARILLAFAMGIDRSRLILEQTQEVSQSTQIAYERAIEARAAHRPVAQITGTRAFYGRDFTVTGDVLDPRPDTELLIDTALQSSFETVLDLGTGSGCILLTLLAELNSVTGVGVDVSKPALDVATQNSKALNVADRARLLCGSWFEPLNGADFDGSTDTLKFDLIVSNPPYISEQEMAELAPDVYDWEPHLALTPGGDGLAAYREITCKAACFLKPNGRVMVEIGATQGPSVSSLFQERNFSNVRIIKDLSGHDRVVSAGFPVP